MTKWIQSNLHMKARPRGFLDGLLEALAGNYIGYEGVLAGEGADCQSALPAILQRGEPFW